MKKYPLEALLGMRQKRADEKASELAGAVRATQHAIASMHEAREVREKAEGEFTAETQNQQASLMNGQFRAGDLQQADGWRRAELEKILQLSETEQQKIDHARAKHEAEARTRNELAQRDAEVKVIDKHKGGWQKARREAEEQALEEAGTELWTAKNFGPRRG